MGINNILKKSENLISLFYCRTGENKILSRFYTDIKPYLFICCLKQQTFIISQILGDNKLSYDHL